MFLYSNKLDSYPFPCFQSLCQMKLIRIIFTVNTCNESTNPLNKLNRKRMSDLFLSVNLTLD